MKFAETRKKCMLFKAGKKNLGFRSYALQTSYFRVSPEYLNLKLLSCSLERFRTLAYSELEIY